MANALVVASSRFDDWQLIASAPLLQESCGDPWWRAACALTFSRQIRPISSSAVSSSHTLAENARPPLPLADADDDDLFTSLRSSHTACCHIKINEQLCSSPATKTYNSITEKIEQQGRMDKVERSAAGCC